MVHSSTASLASADPHLREAARKDLIEAGPDSVPALVGALSDPATHVRWEAANALAEIAHPSASEGLVHAMEDPDRAVRWLACEAMVKIGRPGLPALVESLGRRANYPLLRESARHVIHDLRAVDEGAAFLTPLKDALESDAPAERVQRAADDLLAGPLAR